MGIEKLPLQIPEQWSPTWFRMFINEVLAPLDTRNALGIGVDVLSQGNSVATLDVTDTIDDAIAAHDALTTAHAAAFAVHVDATDPHPDIIDDLTPRGEIQLGVIRAATE